MSGETFPNCRDTAGRPSDEGVVAVASNNLACLKGSSWSRPPSDSVREKLSASQREAFDVNHALLMLSMGKVRMRQWKSFPSSLSFPSQLLLGLFLVCCSA